MPDQLQFITHDGIDFFDGKFQPNQSLSYNITPEADASILGRTITPRAASRMISTMIKQRVDDVIKQNHLQLQGQDRATVAAFVEQKLTADRIAVEFGKETLQAILRQKNCIGIRFTSCTNLDGVESLVAMGIEAEKDNNGNIVLENGNIRPVPLKKDKYKIPQDQMETMSLLASVNDPIIKEQGNGDGTNSAVALIGRNIMEMLPERMPILTEIGAIDDLSKKISHTMIKTYFASE